MSGEGGWGSDLDNEEVGDDPLNSDREGDTRIGIPY